MFGADIAIVLQDELDTSMRLCGITNLEEARGHMEYLNTSELEQILPPNPIPGSLLFGALRTRGQAESWSKL